MSLHVAFDGITKEFGPVRVLHGVSFDLHPGQPRTVRATGVPKEAHVEVAAN